MFHNGKHNNPRQAFMGTLALTAIAFLLIAVGTLAWLRLERGLLTMTKIQFSTLDLKVKEIDSIPIELGEINIREAGRKEMPFRIQSNPGTQYILQLGHTTNLKLNYAIYPVESWDSTNLVNPLAGQYLNRDTTTELASSSSRGKTYDTGDNVQQNAEPLYWQSTAGACVCSESGFDYYVLVVSWNQDDNSNVIDKETEMIYLTAGLGGYANDETTQTTEATQ